MMASRKIHFVPLPRTGTMEAVPEKKKNVPAVPETLKKTHFRVEGEAPLEEDCPEVTAKGPEEAHL